MFCCTSVAFGWVQGRILLWPWVMTEMVIRGPKLLNNRHLLAKECAIQSVNVYQVWQRWKSPRPACSNCYNTLALCRTRVLFFHQTFTHPLPWQQHLACSLTWTRFNLSFLRKHSAFAEMFSPPQVNRNSQITTTVEHKEMRNFTSRPSYRVYYLWKWLNMAATEDNVARLS